MRYRLKSLIADPARLRDAAAEWLLIGAFVSAALSSALGALALQMMRAGQ